MPLSFDEAMRVGERDGRALPRRAIPIFDTLPADADAESPSRLHSVLEQAVTQLQRGMLAAEMAIIPTQGHFITISAAARADITA